LIRIELKLVGGAGGFCTVAGVLFVSTFLLTGGSCSLISIPCLSLRMILFASFWLRYFAAGLSSLSEEGRWLDETDDRVEALECLLSTSSAVLASAAEF